MKGKQKIRLTQPAGKKTSERVKQSRADVVSWEGVERSLFEELREWRFELAKETNKPPYVIFSDETLRQLVAAAVHQREAPARSTVSAN